ncbi:hypothetical protein [Hymenobacter sublimis]|uniref:Uncharacterized protein n=1 Tax=Hymenobacter sublimis TaxID=2933777 RepID=A0ABY4JG28_9BACT|nr:hypothetical protein [Hymenobacter sublimis]UPL50862.1 hypothetical protein MWH26_08140 [Hymenobacter sublimis]
MTQEVRTRFRYNQERLAFVGQSTASGREALLEILSSTIQDLSLLSADQLTVEQRFRLLQLKLQQKSIKNLRDHLEGYNMWLLVYTTLLCTFSAMMPDNSRF